jgi:hypothetical protein
MDQQTIMAFAQAVETSLTQPKGHERLQKANAMLYQDWQGGKFNSDRATEIFVMTIERSVPAMLIKTLRELGITAKMASDLTTQFKDATGALDQRPIRTGLLAKILGK